jgi:hypothetical protein
VEDQKILSRQITAAIGSGGAGSTTTSAPAAGTGTAAGPTAATVDAVKAFIAQLTEAQKANDLDKSLSFYTTEDVNAIKTALAAAKDTPAKIAAFQKLLADKAITMPDSMKKDFSEPEGVKDGKLAIPGIDYDKTPADKLTFEQAGDNVVVVAPDKLRETFVKSADGWNIQLDPKERERLSLLTNVLAGIGKVIDTLTAGVNDGSITNETLEAKAKEVGDKELKPAAEKFAKLVGNVMKKAGDSSAPGATTAPAAP